MSNIETLYSKTFKDQQTTSTFKAKGNKINLFIEERENVGQVSIYLKGKKRNILITTLHTNSSNVIELSMFEGESYLFDISKGGESIKLEGDKRADKPAKINISAIWENVND